MSEEVSDPACRGCLELEHRRRKIRWKFICTGHKINVSTHGSVFATFKREEKRSEKLPCAYFTFAPCGEARHATSLRFSATDDMYLVDGVRVSVRVEAVVHVVKHVNDVISTALCCDVTERHNVAEQNCAAQVPLCNNRTLWVTILIISRKNCGDLNSNNAEQCNTTKN